MRTVLLLVLSLGWLAGKMSAQKYSNEFLSIGVGARAQGMGNAVVATVQDVTATAWNPAGLAALEAEGLQLGAMHAEWFGGVGKFDYIGATIPMAQPDRRLGISLIRFGVDEIPNTLSLYASDGTVNFDNVTEFSAADYAFLATYAQRLKTGSGQLYAGGNVKVVHRRIGPFATAWGFGIDLGLQYAVGKWRFGAVARDVTSTFNAWSFDFTDAEKEVLELTNNEIPISSVEITRPQLLLGVAHRFAFNKLGITPELNLAITTDGQRNTLIASNPFSIDPAFGVEADYSFLFLRAGLSQFQRFTDFDNAERIRVRPALGVGLRIATLHLDYAFTDIGDQNNTYSHIISLTLSMKNKKSQADSNSGL
ncbi:MAG TPA: PorV/PorQ family protein [Saprospiraceae bacterium]|nr:PorV/PorQ family protein [Saprospiraceae bacterium]HMP25414.1 PorV/PorQ family protein [Saprospiraceae bacterium]